MTPADADADGLLPEPPEHARYARYLEAFAQIPEAQIPDAQEFALVTTVLDDPDQLMAEAAVVRHLDRRAAALYAGPLFPAWAQAAATVVGGYPFSTRRLREWALFRAITVGAPWDSDALLSATNWLQRMVSERMTARDALHVLADAGRTRRVRNTARTRLNTRRR